MPVAEYRMVVTPHRIPVADIKRNKPSPFQIIDNTSFETTVEGTEMANGIRRILLPHKKDDDPPATAFGLFLGYTLKMNEADYSLPVKQFKKKMAECMEHDIAGHAAYIKAQLEKKACNITRIMFTSFP